MVSPYRTPPSTEPMQHSLRWLKAVSVAALIFLATSTATMMVLISSVQKTWRMVEAARLHRPSPSPPPPPRPLIPPQQVAAPAPPPPPPPMASPPVAPAFFLSGLGLPTHAPAELFRRATALRTAGIDVTLTETRITAGAAYDPSGVVARRIVPLPRAQGIRISKLPEDAIERMIGLQEGDVLTAMNGYTLDSPDAARAAYASVQASGAAVLELRRGTRPMVIKVLGF